MAANSTVLKHVRQFFILSFPNTPKQAFTPNRNVRIAFQTETWKGLADAFNKMAWMKRLGVKITQGEMGDENVKTIRDVAELITSKAGRKVGRLSGAEFPRPRPTVLV